MSETPTAGSDLYRDSRNTGPQTRARYEYQDACVALRCIHNLRSDSSIVGVVLEWTTDYVLLAADGGREMVSVKHREPGQNDWSYADLRKENVFRDLHAVWNAMGENGNYVFESNRGFSRTAVPFVTNGNARRTAAGTVVRLARDLNIDVDEAKRFLARFDVRPNPLPDRYHIVQVAISDLHGVMHELGLDPAGAAEAYRAIVGRIAAASTERPPSGADRIERLAGLMRDVAARTAPRLAQHEVAMAELRDLVIEVGRTFVRAPAAPDTDPALRRIAEAVASRVLARCSDEASRLWLRRPAPIPVRWTRSASTTAAGPELPQSGTVAEIGALYRGLPSRQLVIKGAAGSGKTATTILLSLSLLEDARDKEGPIPVPLEASSWNPRTEHLRMFVVRRLVEDFRAVTGRSARAVSSLRELVSTGKVIPVLDGLDELSWDLLPLAVEHLDQLSSEGQPMVVTWRSREYGSATKRAGFSLSRASVIELEPLGVDQVISFLARHDLALERWAPVFEGLTRSPDGILAQTLSSAMMTGLARITYAPTDTNPQELARLASLDAVTARLIDVFVSTAYRDDRLHPPAGSERLIPYDPVKARRWLSHLACHLQELGAKNLNWWQFARDPKVLFLAGFGIGALAALLVAVTSSAWIGMGRGAGAGLFVWLLAALWISSGLSGGHLSTDALFSPARSREARARATMEGRTGDLWVYRLLAPLLWTTWWYRRASGVARGWIWFRLRHGVLAVRGHLPWRLERFLRDAHRRGVLRRYGAATQFRHALIQEHLAQELLAARLQNRSDSGDVFATIWLAHLWTAQGARDRALGLLRDRADNGSEMAARRWTDLLAESRDLARLRHEAGAGSTRAAVRLGHILLSGGDARAAVEAVRPYANDSWWAAECLAAGLVRQGEAAEAVALLKRHAKTGNMLAQIRLLKLRTSSTGDRSGSHERHAASGHAHDWRTGIPWIDRHVESIEQGDVEQVQRLIAAGNDEAASALAYWLQVQGRKGETVALLRRLVEEGRSWHLNQLIDLVGPDDAEQALELWHRYGQSYSSPDKVLRVLIAHGHPELAIGVLHQRAMAGDPLAVGNLVELLAGQGGLPPLPGHGSYLYSEHTDRVLFGM